MGQITHYDLFAGIGGFSLALEEVFGDEKIKHIFCEWESFPAAVLRRHWPEGEFWGDIAELVAHTGSQGLEGELQRSSQGTQWIKDQKISRDSTDGDDFTIVTGGFPCQPFSSAGQRRGTADDRHQWPNMFKVIRNVKPRWVIAENVRGLVTWNEGMVLEQVCTDLEAEGYQVQPFIIPAVAVNAPHRRDRVWIIAHAERSDEPRESTDHDRSPQAERLRQRDQVQESGQSDRVRRNIADSKRPRRQQGRSEELAAEATKRSEGEQATGGYRLPEWDQDWREVAFATCHAGVDDGLPRVVDGVSISRARWRKESLKAYGNAIVPEVAIQIMKAIREAEYEHVV
jgi:DNA (cytosine-5)-methyltransferase 1